jgi:hypothetical protein
LEQLHAALCGAFNLDSLDRMLAFRLGKSRPAFVQNASLETVVYQVLDAASREGWLVELAQKAHAFVPGNPALREVAKAVGVLDAPPTVGPVPSANGAANHDSPDSAGEPPQKTTRRTVELHVDRDFDAYTREEEDSLIAAIKRLLKNTDVKLVGKEPGSVRLKIELDPADADKLIALARSGALDDHGVVGANIVGEVGEVLRAEGEARPAPGGTSAAFTPRGDLAEQSDQENTARVKATKQAELEAAVAALKAQVAILRGQQGAVSSTMATNPGNPSQGTTAPHTWKQAVHEWAKKLLDVKLMFSVLALLVALYAVALNRTDVEINFNKEGTVVVTRGNEVMRAIILLPANRPWLNTGLEVKKGQKMTITASGSVNLAVHRLVEAANDHKRPRLGWLGPDGGTHPYKTDLDNARSKYLIAPDPNNYGALLACIVPLGDPDPGKENPRPKGIKRVGSRGSITAESTGTLWLVVNDVMLTEQSRDAYVAPQNILDEVYGPGKVTVDQKVKEWEAILKGRYFTAFFDDNIGEFLIHVDFTK